MRQKRRKKGPQEVNFYLQTLRQPTDNDNREECQSIRLRKSWSPQQASRQSSRCRAWRFCLEIRALNNCLAAGQRKAVTCSSRRPTPRRGATNRRCGGRPSWGGKDHSHQISHKAIHQAELVIEHCINIPRQETGSDTDPIILSTKKKLSVLRDTWESSPFLSTIPWIAVFDQFITLVFTLRARIGLGLEAESFRKGRSVPGEHPPTRFMKNLLLKDG